MHRDQCDSHYVTCYMQFTQECLYKYRTVQHTLGEKDRETISFSTDVHWHCESSKDTCINQLS